MFIYIFICIFVQILIAKNVENVRELGSVSSVATSIRDNVSGELQSTRIGVMRKTTLISAAARTKRQQEIYFTDRVSKNDSGDTQNAMDATYYDVILNAKSFASNNAMAVDPSERPVALEWDRRLIVRAIDKTMKNHHVSLLRDLSIKCC